MGAEAVEQTAARHYRNRAKHPALAVTGGLAVCLWLLGCASTSLPDFEPVNLESGSNTIRLEPIGRYSGGVFALTETSTPRYDPGTQRLYVPRTDIGQILALDIADPARPRTELSILTVQFGGLPKSIDMKNGILAVALQPVLRTLPGGLVFLDADGRALAGPVRVGYQPSMVKFTPDGRHVVVANSGEANADYSADPEGSVSIVELVGIEACPKPDRNCSLEIRVSEVNFQAFNTSGDALRAAGVRIYGPDASVAQDLEPESLAISPDSRTAWVVLQRNNAVAVVDIPGAAVLAILPLGTKDHRQAGNGIDASDRDDTINIHPWPLRSYYQPDGVASYVVDGRTFLVTANEGDPRDFDDYTELVRVSELRLDPGAFPDAASLQQTRNLGRLRVTGVEGDSDGDGDFDEILMLGSRSFGIWTANWDLAFDSGDELERIAARAVPEAFNTAGNETRFDQTSDSRGPEPETLAVGQVGSRTYAFVAPERIGGVYVYDVTRPETPIFQQYINYRNFDVDPARVCQEKEPQSDECAGAGDLEPEGVLFIPAEQAPEGKTLVVLVHEVSDSTTLYRVEPKP
jgi:DNA-binding beta-propeller fold protein YncE